MALLFFRIIQYDGTLTELLDIKLTVLLDAGLVEKCSSFFIYTFEVHQTALVK